ncbi:hypothetical protein EYF80_032116 [Liparis tanakae]|uniref:Uncharacterized protein n=1 Tax=Liparis tanakae TaxID=230148 RepID=A0A4Z2GYG7_9TELE|nr:hypothetical protein EYF80_032116 [Liparis tanakae]
MIALPICGSMLSRTRMDTDKKQECEGQNGKQDKSSCTLKGWVQECLLVISTVCKYQQQGCTHTRSLNFTRPTEPRVYQATRRLTSDDGPQRGHDMPAGSGGLRLSELSPGKRALWLPWRLGNTNSLALGDRAEGCFCCCCCCCCCTPRPNP